MLKVYDKTNQTCLSVTPVMRGFFIARRRAIGGFQSIFSGKGAGKPVFTKNFDFCKRSCVLFFFAPFYFKNPDPRKNLTPKNLPQKNLIQNFSLNFFWLISAIERLDIYILWYKICAKFKEEIFVIIIRW